MAARREGYWSKSFALLRRDVGWIKPLLVLSAARMVPIIGPFGVDGYALEWARLTSWGVDSSPKQKNVDIGACIVSGARAFAAAFGYLFVFLLVVLSLGHVGDSESWTQVLVWLLGLPLTVLLTVIKLRATIYQSIGAGYQLNRIADMVKRDYRGLLKITGINLVIDCVTTVVIVVLALAASPFALSGLPSLLSELFGTAHSYMSEADLARLILSILSRSIVLVVILRYLDGIGRIFRNLITTTAVGLWMRQFDVRAWGESADPLPGDGPDDHAAPRQAYQTSVPSSVATQVPSVTPDATAFPLPMPVEEPESWSHSVETTVLTPQSDEGAVGGDNPEEGRSGGVAAEEDDGVGAGMVEAPAAQDDDSASREQDVRAALGSLDQLVEDDLVGEAPEPVPTFALRDALDSSSEEASVPASEPPVASVELFELSHCVSSPESESEPVQEVAAKPETEPVPAAAAESEPALQVETEAEGLPLPLADVEPEAQPAPVPTVELIPETLPGPGVAQADVDDAGGDLGTQATEEASMEETGPSDELGESEPAE